MRRSITKAVLTGEQPACRRTEGGDRDPFPCRQGKQLSFDGAVEQAVAILDRLITVNAHPIAGRQRVTQLRGRNFAGADVPYLPGLHQIVHRLQRLLDGCRRVRLHGHIKVDVVRLEAAQATVNRLHDVASRKAPVLRTLGERIEHLGREDEPVANLPLPQPAANHPLGRPATIAVRRVEVVDARVPGVVHQGEGRFLVLPPSEELGGRAYSPKSSTAKPQHRDA